MLKQAERKTMDEALLAGQVAVLTGSGQTQLRLHDLRTGKVPWAAIRGETS
jgi:hypothetical protein